MQNDLCNATKEGRGFVIIILKHRCVFCVTFIKCIITTTHLFIAKLAGREKKQQQNAQKEAVVKKIHTLACRGSKKGEKENIMNTFWLLVYKMISFFLLQIKHLDLALIGLYTLFIFTRKITFFFLSFNKKKQNLLGRKKKGGREKKKEKVEK